MKSAIRPGAIAGIVVVAGVAFAVVMGFQQGLGTAVLVLATLALLGVIALLSASVRSLSGDTPLTLDEAVSLGAPSAEEEQKRAVLRALKDLEYERSVGKISEEDYREFSARYREEARRLIAKVDETLATSHALAERLLAERVASAGLITPGADGAEKGAAATATEPRAEEPKRARADESKRPTGDEDGEEEAEDEEEDDEDADADADEEDDGKEEPAASPVKVATSKPSSKATNLCANCNTSNDADARFCKGCGLSLRAAQAADAEVEKKAVAAEETSS